LPADFAHFKRSTVGHTVLMGRTTFDSIGHPLKDRSTIVLTRDLKWSWPGITVAHDLQEAIDAAEDLPGDLMVAGGSHIYAATISVAHMQVISEVDQLPQGDAFYPQWDRDEWVALSTEQHEGFNITWWNRNSTQMRTTHFELSDEAASAWWNKDWSPRLEAAVRAQQARTTRSDRINWTGVHQAAMQVILETAEEQLRQSPLSSHDEQKRRVRLSRHLSMQDLQAVQGALFHWSDFLAPRRQTN
jgi:dihydrofolate reductase